MKNILAKIILALIYISLFGCNEEYKYHSGGPYYYKSDIANHQPFRPNEEITKNEANELADKGYSYYIAFFNDNGRPTTIEKYYKGKMDRKSELFYENGKLFKSIVTNEKGNKKTKYYK